MSVLAKAGHPGQGGGLGEYRVFSNLSEPGFKKSKSTQRRAEQEQGRSGRNDWARPAPD